MLRYVGSRLLQAIPVVFVVTFVIFAIIRLLPGDPAMTILGETSTPRQREEFRLEMGLDQPIPVQYVIWLGELARGDFGISIRSREPVATMLVRRAPVTLQLTLYTVLLAVAFGVPAGIIAALRRNTWVDAAVSVSAIGHLALPNFWTAILLIMLFGVWLRWLPTAGATPLLQDPLLSLKMMILPTLTLSGSLGALIMRQTRASLLAVLAADFVRTARAKGAREPRVVVRHALRNALLPVVTVVGLQIGTMLGGAVITESVFSMPGVGRMLIEGIFARDFPAVQGAILFLVLGILLVNILIDLTYFFLDKRIAR